MTANNNNNMTYYITMKCQGYDRSVILTENQGEDW